MVAAATNRPLQLALGNGVTTAFAWDAADRLTRLTHADQAAAALVDLSYGYDANGNPTYKRDHLRPDHSELYAYDARDRLREMRRGTLTLATDGSVAEPAEVVDAALLVDANKARLQAWELDQRGNWLTFESTTKTSATAAPDVLTDDRTHNGVNEVLRSDRAFGDGIGAALYDYDLAGNLTAVHVLGDLNCDGVTNFDDLDAFITALVGEAAYEAAYPGCLLILGDINGDTLVNFDDMDAFIETLIGGPSAAAMRYVYDDENRLTAVRQLAPAAPGSQLLDRLTITYDALGRRIASETFDGGGVVWVEVAPDELEPETQTASRTTAVRHVYGAGIEVLEEHEVCGADSQTADCSLSREFVWGPGFPNPVAFVDHTDAGDLLATGTTGGGAETFHYLKGHLGSVVALTNSDGEVVERYTYAPYGTTHIESRNATTLLFESHGDSRFANPFAWTSQRYDANVKLYHFLFRSYSPDLGRWFQRDPAGYIDGPNLYQYVRSMASRFMDRYGLESWAWYEGWGSTWGALFGTHGIGAAAEAWGAGYSRAGDNAVATYNALRAIAETAATEVAVQSLYGSGAIGDEEVSEFSPAASTAHDLTIAGGGSTASGAAMVAGSVWNAVGAAAADVLAGNFTVEDVMHVLADVAFVAAETALTFAAAGAVVKAARGAGAAAKAVGSEGAAARNGCTTGSRLATQADEAVFWSGIDSGEATASRWVAQNGGATLETTMAARGVTLPAWDPTNPAVVAAWRQASQDFAAGASGHVRVLQGGAVRVNSVWAEVEYPALIANPNVTGITAIDAATGQEVLLWAR